GEAVEHHGKFLSTREEVGWNKDDRLRDCARRWFNRGYLVLRHAEIHKGWIPADPAGAVSARYSRHATGNGLSILSQLCRSSCAIERAQHCDVHELPHA